MNKRTKFLQLLNSSTPQNYTLFRPILMHFAARYNGKTYGEFASDYKTLAECNLKCFEDFDIDALGLISDPYRETSAFGARVTFPDEAVPVCKDTLVKSIEDIKALKNPDIYKAERTLDRIKAAQEIKKSVDDEVPIIGWIEGPLAESCDLAGINEILLYLMMDPDFVKQLIDKVMVTAKDFAKAQIEAGCDIIGIGDAICSQISVDNYADFVKEKHTELVDYIHSLGAYVKLHICGNITHLLPDIKDVNPDILDIDWLVDMDEAYDILGDKIIRCGNIDPVAVIEQKSREEIKEHTISLCEKEKNRRFILSGGCEITVNTPKENLSVLREFSQSAW